VWMAQLRQERRIDIVEKSKNIPLTVETSEKIKLPFSSYTNNCYCLLLACLSSIFSSLESINSGKKRVVL
jgi:hypothetical protein